MAWVPSASGDHDITVDPDDCRENSLPFVDTHKPCDCTVDDMGAVTSSAVLRTPVPVLPSNAMTAMNDVVNSMEEVNKTNKSHDEPFLPKNKLERKMLEDDIINDLDTRKAPPKPAHHLNKADFADEEAVESGKSSTQTEEGEEDDDVNDEMTTFINDDGPPDYSINDDINLHRRFQNRLGGDMSQTSEDEKPSTPVMNDEYLLKHSNPTLQRTDSDERNFMKTAHNDLKRSQSSTCKAGSQEFFRDVETAAVRPGNNNPRNKTPSPQLRAKRIGLTYPQCPLDPQTLVDHLRTEFQRLEPEVIVVGQENHKDGGLHLHAYMRCNHQISSRNMNIFDIKSNYHVHITSVTTSAVNDEDIPHVYHPNIRIIKDEAGWLRYITKDGNFKAYPAWYVPNDAVLEKAKEQKKSTKSDLICQAIKQGDNIDKVREDYPSFFLMHERQVEYYYNCVQQGKRSRYLKSKFYCITSFVGDGELNNQRIAGWLNDHVIKEHKFRTNNLWIWGGTQLGKTSLVELLIENGVNVYTVDYSTHFFTGISINTQLLVFDEFKGQRTITELNKLADGSRCQLDVKGSTFKIEKPIPVLVLSNFPIEQCFHNVEDAWLNTLRGRFTEINVTKKVEIAINKVPFDLDE